MSQYAYDRFKASYYHLDRFPGPAVGSQAVDCEATTLEGDRCGLSDWRGAPLVLETGSVTCGEYAHGIRPMNEIAARHPGIRFVVLYVREAHPGSRIGQPRTLDEKLEHARMLPQLEPERRTIVVDDIDGTAHRAYGSLPNFIYMFDPDGIVAFRNDWNDARDIEPVIERVAAGERVTEREPFRPAPWTAFRVLRRAGWDAVLDFGVSLPQLLLQHARERKTVAASG